ncbi:MAG: cobalt-precorrin-5B (C(1))-methyltransferase [Candidatus Dormibacteria bacterium]
MATDQESDYGPAPRRRGLRTGFTTGACAAAATRGACLALEGQLPTEVEIPLPAGFTTSFALQTVGVRGGRASASVIKDAGDDPDVTHRAEIRAEVELRRRAPSGVDLEWTVSKPGAVIRRLVAGSAIELRAGRGVGVVTRPGLGLPVGGPAVNPVPRRMISRAVRETLTSPPPLVRVTVSVKDGERLAKRTLNGRLGIVGGLSILGTTGVVRPYSTASWRASVVQAVDVAAAAEVAEVVASTGGRSETYARRLRPGLPTAAFVEMGEFTGHLLKRARDRGVPLVTLAGMIGKMSKIACGHFMTHVAGNQVDLHYLSEVAREAGGQPDLVAAIRRANSARHVQELVIAAGTPGFFDRVAADARLACVGLVGESPRVGVLLFDFEGGLLGSSEG